MAVVLLWRRDDMSEDIKSTFFDAVHKLNEAGSWSCIGDKKQDLRAPVLHVLFAGVQQK